MALTKILIVDDEPSFVLTLEFILKRSGYQITGITTNGEDALKCFKQDPPDILLMDIGLKGNLTGEEVAHKIREFSDTPILFITGYSDLEVERSLKKISHSKSMTKPIATDDLLLQIKSLLKKSAK